MDEITTTALTRISELNNGTIRSYDLDPLDFFEDYARAEDLAGGDAIQNAGITRSVLSGDKGPKRDIVLLNAGAALVAAEAAENIKHGIGTAEKSIDSGRALEKLEHLSDYTQENG
jgi:anthranilate phosphoribosyltransferase